MAAFYGLCLALFLVMRFAPLTPLGTWLNRRLVIEPIARLAGMRRHHLIYAVIMSAMMIAGGEMVVLMGPELLAMWALHLSLTVDALLVAYALAAVALGRNALRYASLRWRRGSRARRLVAARRRRQRLARRQLPPSANDDDPAPVLLAA